MIRKLIVRAPVEDVIKNAFKAAGAEHDQGGSYDDPEAIAYAFTTATTCALEELRKTLPIEIAKPLADTLARAARHAVWGDLWRVGDVA